jgi:hypothetical protein
VPGVQAKPQEAANDVNQEVVFQGDSMVGKLEAASGMAAFRALHGNVEVTTAGYPPNAARLLAANHLCSQMCYGSEPSMDTTWFEQRLCKGEHLWAKCYDNLVAKARLGRTVVVLWWVCPYFGHRGCFVD